MLAQPTALVQQKARRYIRRAFLFSKELFSRSAGFGTNLFSFLQCLQQIPVAVIDVV
jgi:hypothetical protein